MKNDDQLELSEELLEQKIHHERERRLKQSGRASAKSKVEPKSNQYEGTPTYGGIGINSGSSKIIFS